MGKKEKKKTVEKFSGVVIDANFRVRGKHYPKGSTYASEDKRSIEYLKEINKLK